MACQTESTTAAVIVDGDVLSPEEERLTLTVHQEQMTINIFTNQTIAKLRNISKYIKGWDDHGRRCAICKTSHETPTPCFANDDLDVPEVEILQGLLDNTLEFDWNTDGHQFLVFSLCRYFLIDQDYVFPSFYRSLRHAYVHEDDQYQFLPLIYTMAEAEYDVLASRLLDYFNKFSREHFVSHSLLFRARSLHGFLAAARNTLPSLAKKRRFHAKAIWACP